MIIPHDPLTILEIVARGVVGASVAMLVAAVLVNFARRRPDAREERVVRSPVATGTMTLFIVVYCLLVASRVGAVAVPSAALRVTLIVCGCILMLLGSAVN